ncbi:MAG TPA: hypothetical protein EYQ60_00805 [Myxococcales bacterium]|nr:hypothetical protein [Myxococcales bacterium]
MRRLKASIWMMLCVSLAVEPARAQDEMRAPATPALDAVGDPFDPYRGMEADGRIPKVDKSAFVSDPDNWRYVPEGRIKPGNLFERFLVSSFVTPLVFANSDIGTGVGLALTDIDFRKQRRREFLGGFFSYTTEGQQSYVLLWRRWLKHLDLPEGGILQEERSFVRAGGGYRKTLTRRFFGIGPSTKERDETSFTDEVVFLDVGLSISLDSVEALGPYSDALSDFVIDVGLLGEGHWLAGGRVSGVPSTNDPLAAGGFPGLFAESDGIGLGWFRAGARWDTRDSQTNAYRGSAIGLGVDAALAQSKGRVGAIYTIFGDKVFPVWPIFHDGGSEAEEHPPTDALALHFLSSVSSGDLPFFDRPTLGGIWHLRGFVPGRFRDDAIWTAAAEYRFWVIPRGFTVWRHIRIERIGAAVFYEVGGVGADAAQLFHETVRQSYGVSARATVERTAIFRADFGFSSEGLNFSAGFGLAF